ncbi:MAG: FG-GAP repeat protein [Planctomycetota bacterium]|nr:FG-GAP repeat protein [Planctomycetota bacterium]
MQVVQPSGAASDRFGHAVAIDGDTMIVGVPLDDVGVNSGQGSAWTFDVPADDFSLAYNEVTGVSYPTLAAALLPATSGQQVSATEAAWRTMGTLNTLGRSLALRSSGDLRTPSTSTLELGGSSMVTSLGGALDVFGPNPGCVKSADFDQSGFVDVDDFVAYLAAFEVGC